MRTTYTEYFPCDLMDAYIHLSAEQLRRSPQILDKLICEHLR